MRSFVRDLFMARVPASYPVYIPPNPFLEACLLPEALEENLIYFLNNKNIRLASLEKLTRIRLCEKNVDQLDIWVSRNAAMLEKVKNSEASFTGYSPRWERDYMFLNVIFDIGIFIGEIIVNSSDFSLEWNSFFRNEPLGKPGHAESVQRVSIFYKESDKKHSDPIQLAYRLCTNTIGNYPYSSFSEFFHDSKKKAMRPIRENVDVR